MNGIRPEILERIGEKIVRGPFGQHLGFELVALEEDHCVVRLPLRAEVANGIGVIHGGAISALVDTCAVGAAWASARNDARTRGATVGLTVNYLAPGLEADLYATATVVRRGGAICVLSVDVLDADERHVATGLVTYRLRQARDGDESVPTVLAGAAGSGHGS